MKLIVKKIYCPTCQKLVMPVEEKTANGAKVNCPKCKNTIWTKEVSDWRYTKVEY